MSSERTALAGKNVVMTGGSSGFGRHLLDLLASQGCNIIVASRSEPQAASAADAGTVEFIETDLSSMGEVEAFAAAARDAFCGVDLLINNAGSLDMSGGMSPDGLEHHLAVNYLSHYLLTMRISDIMDRTAGSLVVNTGSAASNLTRGCTADDFLHQAANARVAYERSKWAVSAFSFALSDRFRAAGSSIACVLLQPPFMDTRLVRNNARNRVASRMVLKALKAFGAFTDTRLVARSAFDLVMSKETGRGDYAVWSRKQSRFEWSDRPDWSRDEDAFVHLIDTSNAVLESVVGTKAPETGDYWRRRQSA